MLGILLTSSLPAITIIPDENIDPVKDVIMLDNTINKALADTVNARIHKLQKVNKDKPIYLLINSYGGEIIQGSRIISAMQASKRPVYTVSMGTTASMAAAIHSYGVKRYITPFSELMYHLAGVGLVTNAVAAKQQLDHLEVTVEELDKNLIARSKVTASEFHTHQLQEWWISSAEALQYHLVDDIVMSTAFVSGDKSVETEKKPEAAKKEINSDEDSD